MGFNSAAWAISMSEGTGSNTFIGVGLNGRNPGKSRDVDI